MMGPYINVFSDPTISQDNPRTKLLELCDSKVFLKDLKIYHKREIHQDYDLFIGYMGTLQVKR